MMIFYAIIAGVAYGIISNKLDNSETRKGEADVLKAMFAGFAFLLGVALVALGV